MITNVIILLIIIVIISQRKWAKGSDLNAGPDVHRRFSSACPRRGGLWWSTGPGGTRTGGRRWDCVLQEEEEATSGGLISMKCHSTAVTESRMWAVVVIAVPTRGLEPLDVARCAEVEAPQVEEEEQQGDDGDEDERDDGGGHDHHANILEK